MKLLALPLVLLAAALAVPSGGAATNGSFCSVARGVAHDLSVLTSNGTRPNAKGTYLRIAAAEPALSASAPGSLKPHLRPVFGFVNLVIADMKKANWQVANLTPYLSALLPRAQAAHPHLLAVDAYLKGTCKLG